MRESSADQKLRVDARRRKFVESPPGILVTLRSRVFRLLLGYLKPRIAGVILISILNLINALIGGMRVLVLMLVLGAIIGEKIDLASSVGVLGLDVSIEFMESWFSNENGLLIGVAILVAITIMTEFLNYITKYLARRIQARLTYQVRSDLIDKLFRLELSYFDENKSGDIAYLQNALVGRFTGLLPSAQAVISAGLDMLVALGLMLMISGWLVLLLVVLGALTTLILRLFTKKMRLMSFDSEEASRLSATHFLETLYGVRLVKQGGQEGRVKKMYRKLAWGRESTVLRFGNYRELSGSLVRFGGLLVVILAAFGANLFSGLNILDNVGLGVGYLYLALRISGSFNKVQAQWLRISSILPQFLIVADFLLDEEHVEAAVNASLPRMDSIQQRVAVDQLTFRYQLDKGILNGISLDFQRGTITALVGLSGSGKTTLLELLAGIRDPQSGQIMVDGKNLAEYDIASYRPLVGYVNQEAIVFHDTLLENLRYLNPAADLKDVERAVKLAAAEEFVKEIENGYNTVLGERGAKISGGQRQRIVIARVLLQDPDVLLLDEATSSLDLYTEALIYENLMKLKNNKIIIVAAHRLSAITQFDNIVVFQDGLIVEQGTHADLMTARQLYYHLYKLQEYSPGAASLSINGITRKC